MRAAVSPMIFTSMTYETIVLLERIGYFRRGDVYSNCRFVYYE